MGRGRLRFVLKHYTRAQFHHDFVPAERERLRALQPSQLREGQRAAYLDTLLALRSIRGAHVLSDEEGTSEVAEALFTLRGMLLETGERVRAPAERIALAELPWQLEEHAFESTVPMVGPLIARFRALWNSVAARWTMRALMEQQGDLNLRLARALDDLQQQVDAQREELAVAQGIATALDREAVDTRRLSSQALHTLRLELEHLAARIAAVERAERAVQPAGDGER
jgi:hypothetical protein